MILRLLAGAALAAIVSAVATRARILSGSGAVAATLAGTVAVATGWSWAALLLVFFTLTSAVSAYGAERKRALTRDVIAKGGRRDAVQVLSNGGIFTVAAVGWAVTSSTVWIAAGAGAIAAAAGDSWSTETGLAFGGRPRSITSGKRLPRGTSGGVTPAGSLGGIVGAAVMAGTVLTIGWPLLAAFAAFFAGVLGMLIDSVLGATLQACHLCPGCGTETEQRVHHCGRGTRLIRGARWIDNDMVNTLTTLAGAAIGAIVFSVGA